MGKDWLHEIKYDGYRMHAPDGRRPGQLLTQTCLDLCHVYLRTIEAASLLKVKPA